MAGDTAVGPAAYVTGEGAEFERLDDGSVRVTVSKFAEPVVCYPQEWAGLVASVSWAGYTEARYGKAHRFHSGDEPAPDSAHWSDGTPVDPAETAAQG